MQGRIIAEIHLPQIMTVGILIIATNNYITFVPPLVASAREHLMPGIDKKFFCFTNQAAPEDIVRIETEHIPWPGPALFRYHMFLKNADRLRDVDYLFYCDADMRFAARVGEEILGDLVATIHPGFYRRPTHEFTYERRRESRAYVPHGHGRKYFAGGFNGGRTQRFLEMAATIKEMVDDDQKAGITAVWHDESYMNRYMIEHQPTKELSPSYCYPESWKIPFVPRLLALDKDHGKMRGIENTADAPKA